MTVLPPGDLRALLVNGAIAGVSAVVSFLPQVLLMFLFIGLLEESGYMARAAFIMDRVMGRFGLHGKSFIPLLSSFACAIPGIMATRTIESPRDRLATMLVAPLMSCSARLPVYTLMIAAFVPDIRVLGTFSMPGLTLLGLYLLGIMAALADDLAGGDGAGRGRSPRPARVIDASEAALIFGHDQNRPGVIRRPGPKWPGKPFQAHHGGPGRPFPQAEIATNRRTRRQFPRSPCQSNNYTCVSWS